MKAIDPKVGKILDKALESLEDSMGKIEALIILQKSGLFSIQFSNRMEPQILPQQRFTNQAELYKSSSQSIIFPTD